MKNFTRAIWTKIISFDKPEISLLKVFSFLVLLGSCSIKGYAAGNYFPTGTPTVTGAATFCQNDPATPLTVNWNNTTCGVAAFSAITVTVQWFSNNTATNSGGTLVYTTPATTSGVGLVGNSTYTPSTSAAGTLYYYAEISWTAQGCAIAGLITSSISGVVTVNPVPSAISGNATICNGASTILSNTTGGGAWSSNNGSVADFDPGTNVARGFDAGIATITYMLPTTCYVSTTLTVNALPDIFGVTVVSGLGSYCEGGAGVPIGLNGSQSSNIGYQLRLGNTNMGSPVAGTSTPISFGNQTTAGTYTVLATNLTTLCATGMASSVTVTVNPLPATFDVTGGGSYCLNGGGVGVGLSGSVNGVSYQLYHGAFTVDAPMIGTGLGLNFGSQTATGDYTVVASDGVCTRTMTGKATIAINDLPTVFAVSGSGSFCAGGTGLHVYLSSSEVGVNYVLIRNGTVSGSPVAGTGFNIDFGAQSLGGDYTIAAIRPSTGCTQNMSGTAHLVANDPPAAATISAGDSYCANGVGVTVTLSSSESGVDYQLYNGNTAVGSSIPGTGFGLNFGPQTAAGTYTISANNSGTGCSAGMSGSSVITIDPLPGVHTVTGGGNYCTGTNGVHVGLSFSEAGINYQLYYGAAPSGVALSGTNGTLDFGLQTAAGTYTVMAIDAVTGCTSNMSDHATVGVDLLPTAFNISGGGSYCAGGAGKVIGLNGSQSGVNYQLYKGLAAVGSPIAGTGSSFDFGLQTATGSYTIKAVNASTACTNTMTGTATISTNTVPVTYTVTGGGDYCQNGTGATIGLNGSEPGVDYQLYLGATTAGASVTGTGSSIVFDPQTADGSYTVLATNASCTSPMANAVIVTATALPTQYAVTGGGTMCADGPGFHVGLGGSNIGISYQLIRDGSPVGGLVAGTGFALDFGVFTTGGSYVVSAINMSTSCTNNMTGNADNLINDLPTAFNVTGGGSYCPSGSGKAVGLSNSQLNVNYQLYRGSTAVGAVVPGTGFGITFNLQTVGTYSVSATSSAGCSNKMTGSVTVSFSDLPTAYNVTGGGGYCQNGTGVHVNLSGSTSGVSYQLYADAAPVAVLPGSGYPLDFGLQTIEGAYTVIATDGTTLCSTNMATMTTVSINPLPVAQTVIGGGSYCEGGAGVNVGMNGSQLGVNYQLYRGGVAVGSLIPGTGFAMSLGQQTVGGSYTVAGFNATNGCTNLMAPNAVVVMDPLPIAYTLTGGGGYCANTTGAPITLSGSESGVNYQLYKGATVIGGPVPGTGAGLEFGPQAAAGSYTVVATRGTCTNNMSGNITIHINPLPVIHNVTGGGSYCSGASGVHVGLDLSDAGTTYQLYNGGSVMSGITAGTGGAIDFGFETVAGTYTVLATDGGTLCATGMAGVATVSVNPLPLTFQVTGGGHYCTGSAGINVTLNGSNTGINYQLALGGVSDGSPLAGTGGALDFGPKTAEGIYTVRGIDANTGCTSNMTSSVTVTADPLPVAQTVTGTGHYCAGDAGLNIGLTGSFTGFSYQLFHDDTLIATQAGTGTAIFFGLQTTQGTYTVLATNTITATHCSSIMSGNATITIDPLPTLYAVTGGGGYCDGGTGVHVKLNGSNTGISYQLYLDGSLEATPLAGTGGVLDFGLKTVAGVYTVKATNVATNCVRDMAASATVVINPLPATIFGFDKVCLNSTNDLNDATSGGTWSSGNQLIATVDSFTGVVKGLSVGTTTIVYKLSTGCSDVINMTVNALPTPYLVTGGGGYCIGDTGVHIGLNGSETGVSYQLINGPYYAGFPLAGTNSALDYGLQTTEGTYSVIATTTATGCSNTMFDDASVAINQLPFAFSVTGGGNYCQGGVGQHVGLNGSASGVNYQLYRDLAAVGTAVAGTGGTIDFGLKTTAGNYTVKATNATTGCRNDMTGSVTVVIDPLPVAYNVTGGGTYCAGGVGYHVSISGSELGVKYQLNLDGSPIGGLVSGTGNSIDFGPQLTAGLYTVSAKTTATSCTANMSGSATIIVNPAPSVYNVTGGGGYCVGGTGTHVTLSGSNSGINYQLYFGSTQVGGPVAGTGAGLDFGLQTAEGTYSVLATHASNGCTTNMSGGASVFTNPLPTAYNVTGSGSYCAGGAGMDVSIAGSEVGVNYQLYSGALPVGSALPGTGGALDFGLITTAGTYTVAAVNPSTTCMNNMSGGATIAIYPLPLVFTVQGGGSYCTGGSGLAVTMTGSESGVNYQLYNGVNPVGSVVPGTGSSLNFGLQTAGGIYTVKAANQVTNCTRNMSGSATVVVSFLPTVYTVQGGGSYCSGGTGVDVTLSGSQVGVNYQVYNSVSGAIGLPIPGTDGALDLGLQTAIGDYTVVATNGCTSNMNGSASVSIDPLPNVYTVTGGGGYCPGGNGVFIGLSGSQTGITYQLYVNGNLTGLAIPGTGNALNFGLKTTTGAYTVIAKNPATTCTANMTSNITVFLNLLPTVYTVSGTGSYCDGGAGLHVQLNGSQSGVNYQLYLDGIATGSVVSGTNAAIDFGAKTAAGVYTAVATSTVTTCSSNMAANAVISIDPLPALHTITGGANYCSGGAGVSIGLDGSDADIIYQLYNSNVGAVGFALAGTTTPLDFGLQTAAGTYTVVATDPATNCAVNMTNVATVGIYALPTAYAVTGSGSYCFGGSGLAVTQNGSDTGVSYALLIDGNPTGTVLAGTGAALNFGLQIAGGNYTVKATKTITGCTNIMTGNAAIVVNSLPATYTVGGGGNYCPGGSGVNITLNGSDTGVSYQLKLGFTAVGAPLPGTGNALDFGPQTGTGAYTVLATKNTTGCSVSMSGASIGLFTQPTAYSVSSGGTFCVGGAGIHVGLASSQLGVNYQLYNGPNPSGSPVAGTGIALDFGAQVTPGIYTIVGSDAITSCARTMTGSAVVIANPLPVAYTVTGGGTFCLGGTGVHVGLSNSNIGIRYQLYNGFTTVGAALAGTGGALDFGLQTAIGNYSVIATNSTTGCTVSMSGFVTISNNPLPTQFFVTGGGDYCTGGTGVTVGLGGSEPNVRYQLYRGSIAIGGPVPGNGLAITFGTITTAGTYSVLATNAFTGCIAGMFNTITVNVNPSPAVFAVNGGGSICAGSTGVHIGINGSVLGLSYQLYRGGTPVGGAIGGTGGALDFGLQNVAGIYTVVSTNPVTTCVSNMSGTATVTVNPLPAVFTVTGGGSYCSGTGGVHVRLNGSATGISYKLYNGGTPVGTLTGTGGPLDFGLQTAAGMYTVVASAVSSGCTNSMFGSATITVTPSVTPAINIVSGSNTSICAGTGVTFTAMTSNGGTAPSYEWQINGISVGTQSTYSYTPANGDVVKVTLASNAACATAATVISSPLTMTVLPNIAPSVTVATNTGTTICKGTLVTFTANPIGGGSAPSYSWTLNGVNVGSGPYYFNSPADGDVIICVLTSNYECRTANIAFSPNVTMTVDSPVVPEVSLVTNPGTTIGLGQSDTLTAVVTNGVTAPTYQWTLNGNRIAGATSATYVSDKFFNGDLICCEVTAASNCGSATGSACATIHIQNVGVINVANTGDVRLLPNPNSGQFTIKGSLGTNTTEDVFLDITDMLGQIVYKERVTAKNGRIDHEVYLRGTLASGMYLLNMKFGAGNKVFHIVIEQ